LAEKDSFLVAAITESCN